MRRLLEAWAAGDMATVETLSRDHLSPDFEWRPLYLDRVYRGIEGMRQVRAEVSEAWEGYRSEIEEIVDLGEHVLVLARISGRGAGSGVPVEQAIAVLCGFQGEQAVWAESFASKDQALEAAGLNGENVDVVLRLHAAFNRADLDEHPRRVAPRGRVPRGDHAGGGGGGAGGLSRARRVPPLVGGHAGALQRSQLGASRGPRPRRPGAHRAAHPRPGEGQRHLHRRGLRADPALHCPRREDHRGARLLQPRGGPRSRERSA